VTLLEAPLSPPLFRRRCLTSGVCVQLFQIVPLQALGVGPEVSNNMSKCPSLSPPESWKRCACEARQAQVLYGTRDVVFLCGRMRVCRWKCVLAFSLCRDPVQLPQTKKLVGQ
jgi:hypothetical protein